VPVFLGLLPAATYALVAYAVRPSAPGFAPVRLALVRAALIVAGLAEVLVEALSLVHGLTRPVIVVTWSVAVVAAGAGALLRRRRDLARPGGDGDRAGIRARWSGLGWAERLLGAGLLVLVLGELILALASPPNNYDSQTYHLPKIEHWVAQHNVQFFPTVIDRQVTLAPGAEYLLLHLRLLTGGDALYNLLQWGAGIGCVIAASRIAGQLGGTRRAQLLAGFVVGTAPIVALESTSTQTDLVVAAWVVCLATLVLDEVRRRTRLVDLILLGTATGMVTLTKATGVLATGPLLLIWAAAQVRQRGAGKLSSTLGRAAAGSVLILACAAVIAGPYLARVQAEFGNPLGPPDLRDSVSLGRHDPPALLVNALHVGYTALDTPFAPLNHAVVDGIDRLSRSLGVDPNDPAITFSRTTFPNANGVVLDEDTSSLPISGGLVLLGAGFLLVRPARRVPAGNAVIARAYAAAFWVNVLVYVTTIRWQPWGNRLVLYLVALGAPLAGLWLDAVLHRGRALTATTEPATTPARPAWWRTATAGLAACAVLLGGVGGWLAVGYGWPRRLVGNHSVFTQSAVQTRFQRRPEWQAGYEWAAAAVRASGAHRVGIVQGDDAWEYPWWVLLPGRDIVAMQSTLRGLPPARPDQVDALVCMSTPDVCASYARPGWRVEMQAATGIGYAVPAATPGAGASPGG
jgi:4-amino-4-deoxy-L-arabinose transferase-like glycosyltransferase